MGKREASKRPAVCTVCGVEFLGGPGRKLCDGCRKKREAERSKARNAARREVWLHTPQHCEVCGAKFTAKSRCRLCPDCRGIKQREAKRQQIKRQIQLKEQSKQKKADVLAPVPPQGTVVIAPPRPESSQRRAGHRPPAPPPKGTKPGSMADVAYRLDKENYERWLRGESPISYGYFVAYLEGRIPLKK